MKISSLCGSASRSWLGAIAAFGALAAVSCGSSGSGSAGQTTRTTDAGNTASDGGGSDGVDATSDSGASTGAGTGDGSVAIGTDSGAEAAAACSPGCAAGFTCISGSCTACGAAGGACCPTGAQDAQTSCNGSLACAGADCTCTVGCSGIRAQRSDGSIWDQGATPMMTASSTLFIAANFSSTGVALVCAVRSDETVWCQGSNSVGQTGDDNVDAVSAAGQVVTASGPLTSITKVFVDGRDGEDTCAIDTSGNAWCWGYGALDALGSGTTADSSVAVPVLTQSGGPQLTGVTDMAVSHDHVCAIKTDGTLWCWGLNDSGQVGAGTAQSPYPYPVQVPGLSHVISVSVSLSVSCAVTSDGGVWCWGTNGSGQLGNGLMTGQSTSPVQVMTSADGGVPFGGASQVAMGSGTVCVLESADRSLWCWGANTDSASDVPVPYEESSLPISGVFVLCNNNQDVNRPSFIDDTGVTHQGGLPDMQLTCP